MDTTNTNPNPQTTDNNQSDYQKILDKYAADLATTEDVNKIPEMPSQLSEAPANPTPLAEPQPLPSPMPLPQLPTEPELPKTAPSTGILPPLSGDLKLPMPPAPGYDYVPPQPELKAPELPQEPIPAMPAVETPHEVPPPMPQTPEPTPIAPPTLEPPKELPPEPPRVSPPSMPNIAFDSMIPTSTKTSSPVAKYFFIVSLLIFLGIAAAVGYSLFKLDNLKKNQNNAPTTETPTPTTSEVQTGTCVLNDKSYQTDESFKAEDGCNTCTCQPEGTIICTDISCEASPTSSTK